MMWFLVIAGIALASFSSQSDCNRAKAGIAGLFDRAYGGQIIGMVCRKR